MSFILFAIYFLGVCVWFEELKTDSFLVRLLGSLWWPFFAVVWVIEKIAKEITESESERK